jgi:hypothetical protein
MHEKKRLAVGVLILAFSSGLRAAENEIDFSHDIVPVLRTHCGKCHLGAKKQGGFSMNTRDLLLAPIGRCLRKGRTFRPRRSPC